MASLSRRTAEADKAIRLAWERERELVKEGKGTRDWTEEQQKDILDPEKGKAYDDKGRAFEGQHMRSVAEYPEYQGDPNNIQFLTKDEHLEAHKGSWQNPTNWYYDPITKEFIDFGDGEIIPCKIIDLTNPIVFSETINGIINDDNHIWEAKEDEANDNKAPPNRAEIYYCDGNVRSKQTIKAASTISHKNVKSPKCESGFGKVIKSVRRFFVDHPEIVGVVIGGVTEFVGSIRGSSNKVSSSPQTSSGTNSSFSDKSDITTKEEYIVEKAKRNSPREHDVVGHKQRYHTKEGIKTKEKAPYSRGGKDT